MDETPQMTFGKPPHGMPTPHLYVANCGPAVGISFSDIKKAFETFGPVVNVQPAGTSGSRVYVSFDSVDNAVAARGAWNSVPCDALAGRVMVIQHAVLQTQPSVSLPLLPIICEVKPFSVGSLYRIPFWNIVLEPLLQIS
jgi:alkylated DNA repair protein alkB family protein 8